MKLTIRRAALENAVKYGGLATPKAIVGVVIREHPEAKDDMLATMKAIDAEVELVNELELEDQKRELLILRPDHEDSERTKRTLRKESAKKLPALPGAVMGQVVTRIPPEPSKYAHIGHAMSFLINYIYSGMYGGRCILRFDDTNPEKASQEFVEAMNSDVLDYLGIRVEKVVFASDRMKDYYEIAEGLIDKGQAYACQCEQSEMSVNRRNMHGCEHRSHSVSENKAFWTDMKRGASGIVLRLKIDMNHKNAVMRDPAIFRVCSQSHYRQGDVFKAWPLYDFESAVEEGHNGITHVLRSNEFDTRIELQECIAELLGLPKVIFKQYGRVMISGASTQGREIRALIESGDYIGWDDPRLVTLKALRRRGIIRETLYELAQSIGMSKTPTTIDYSVIAAINRRLLDKTAKRMFMIENAQTIVIDGMPETIKEFTLAFHPANAKGERRLTVSEEFYIEKKDYEELAQGKIHRLMDGVNFERTAHGFVFHSESHDEYKKAKNKGLIIHYLPCDDCRKAGMFMGDAHRQEVFVENSVKHLDGGEIVQFERWGFARLDSFDDVPEFWFAHR